MSSLSCSEAKMKLCDYFIPLTALVKSFDTAATNTPEALAGQIDSLIQQAQSQALQEGVELNAFQEALFPVLAWADEHISRRHQWGSEHAWQRHLLQRRYFKTGLAGREFFERLEKLPPGEAAVREVYLLCLCLGFMGRYSISPNSAELANIRVEQYKLLQKADDRYKAAEKTALFPKAYTMAGNARPAKQRKPAFTRKISLRRALIFILPPVIVLVVAFILHTELTYAVQNFREAANL
ncbi:MAG: hypothetical protein CL536_00065 [Alcaligenaceae bacterium]|nr:hypothetical protein [Alcaligenaceae bacterium]